MGHRGGGGGGGWIVGNSKVPPFPHFVRNPASIEELGVACLRTKRPIRGALHVCYFPLTSCVRCQRECSYVFQTICPFMG